MPVAVGGSKLCHCEKLPGVSYELGELQIVRDAIVRDASVIYSSSPQSNTFVRRNGFAGTFLVATVRGVFGAHYPSRPRLTEIPILLAELGEIFVIGHRISNVSDVKKNSVECLSGPHRIMLRNDTRGI